MRKTNNKLLKLQEKLKKKPENKRLINKIFEYIEGGLSQSANSALGLYFYAEQYNTLQDITRNNYEDKIKKIAYRSIA